MNFLFHSSEFPPLQGGVGAYTQNMAASLAECGHRVVILTCKVPAFPEEERRNNITILRKYPRSEAGSRNVLRLALDTIDQHGIDIVEGADHLGDCARLLSVKDRPPCVIKLHGCNILDAARESQILFGWQRILIRFSLLRNWRTVRREKQSIIRSDLITAPSHRILKELTSQGLRLPEKSAVIPNPILPPVALDRKETRTPCILMVGRLDIGKGIQFLPHIIQGVVREFPNVKIDIAGGDSYARGLGSLRNWLIAKLGGLVHHVRFLGHVGASEITKAYQRAWVVIIPSRWDNFPTVMLEAMSMGKPVVATPHGGMPEMLEDTLCRTALPESVTFVTLINQLLANPEYRQRAGQSMYAKALDAYSPTRVVSRYLSFVRSSL